MSKTNIIAEEGKQEIIISRIFGAPRELVFKTFTNPETVPDRKATVPYTLTMEFITK